VTHREYGRSALLPPGVGSVLYREDGFKLFNAKAFRSARRVCFAETQFHSDLITLAIRWITKEPLAERTIGHYAPRFPPRRRQSIVREDRLCPLSSTCREGESVFRRRGFLDSSRIPLPKREGKRNRHKDGLRARPGAVFHEININKQYIDMLIIVYVDYNALAATLRVLFTVHAIHHQSERAPVAAID
jgi:hypothetical protein